MEVMRRNHNRIKAIIIRDACSRSVRPRVLDIGCGAGGDILKYSMAGAGEVWGFDPDPDAVAEAEARLTGLGSKRSDIPNFRLWTGSASEELEHLDGAFFDVVSCQFAMHFVLEEGPGAVGHIYRVLKPGGTLVGTIMEDDRVVRGDFEHYSAFDVGEKMEFCLKNPTRYFSGGKRVEPVWQSDAVIERLMDAGFKLQYWRNFGTYISPSEPLYDVSKMYSAFSFTRPCADPGARRPS
jgi:ubiquinone/menaquinone biosynthesis C-methylase UbiE